MQGSLGEEGRTNQTTYVVPYRVCSKNSEGHTVWLTFKGLKRS